MIRTQEGRNHLILDLDLIQLRFGPGDLHGFDMIRILLLVAAQRGIAPGSLKCVPHYFQHIGFDPVIRIHKAHGVPAHGLKACVAGSTWPPAIQRQHPDPRVKFGIVEADLQAPVR